ncbi:MAG: DUF58 domain-containing protein [Bacteroidales bacterium]|nr:DUF58 domain-containing protein [Bacteroidales bacterium]
MNLPPDVIARIDALELTARQVVEGYLAGRHRSPRHGFAVEFAQHREYSPGDDIRRIDWKVFARTERYHLKQYEQETNLIAWLVVDASESMRVSTARRADGTAVSKYDVAAILAAAIGYLAVRQTDSVGLVRLAQSAQLVLRASSKPGQFRELLRILSEGPTTAASQVAHTLRDLTGLIGRRGIVFLLSDLLDDVEELAVGLRLLRSQRHEVVVLQILDAAELDFPFRHPTLFHGLESLPEISTDPLAIRESYLTELHKHLAAVEAVCRSSEADYLRVRTDDDLGSLLAAYLRKRGGQ